MTTALFGLAMFALGIIAGAVLLLTMAGLPRQSGPKELQRGPDCCDWDGLEGPGPEQLADRQERLFGNGRFYGNN